MILRSIALRLVRNSLKFKPGGLVPFLVGDTFVQQSWVSAEANTHNCRFKSRRLSSTFRRLEWPVRRHLTTATMVLALLIMHAEEFGRFGGRLRPQRQHCEKLCFGGLSERVITACCWQGAVFVTPSPPFLPYP